MDVVPRFESSGVSFSCSRRCCLPPPTSPSVVHLQPYAAAMAATAGPGTGSADKASKVKSLLASYYDIDDLDGGNSLHDSPRCGKRTLTACAVDLISVGYLTDAHEMRRCKLLCLGSLQASMHAARHP